MVNAPDRSAEKAEANSAKCLQQKEKSYALPLGMLIYAAVFLVLLTVGLFFLWSFLGAYENSQPDLAVDRYMAALTPEHVCDAAQQVYSQVDSRVQSAEQCRAVMLDAVSEEFHCAKNTSQSTANRQVYAVYSGELLIGTFEIEPQGEPKHGMVPWVVTKETFDLSGLLTEPVQAAAPEGYQVLINGDPLPEDCVTQDGIEYPELTEFYEDYALPHVRSYEAGPILGEAKVTVLDAQGNAVPVENAAAQALDNCSDEEKSALDQAALNFISAYVSFTGNNGRDTEANLTRLKRYIVPDSELATRMDEAVLGLRWVASQKASVETLEISLYSRVMDDLYFCDLNYTANSKAETITSRVKLLLRQTGSGLLAEAMVTC